MEAADQRLDRIGLPGPERVDGGLERVRRADARELELRGARVAELHAEFTEDTVWLGTYSEAPAKILREYTAGRSLPALYRLLSGPAEARP